MGRRSKLIVEDIVINVEDSFVEKYDLLYFIGQDDEGKHCINISSKIEVKSHFNIIEDLKQIVKDSHEKQVSSFNVYCCILWDDGVIERINLTTGEEMKFI